MFMYGLFLIILQLSCIFGRQEELNGNNDDIDVCSKPDSASNLPWLARLVYKRKEGNSISDYVDRDCAANLISNRFMLTVPHCVNNQRKNNEKLFVRLGDFDLDEEVDGNRPDLDDDGNRPQPEEVSVTEIISHPNNNDIALLLLENRVTVTPFVRPICLPNKDIDRNDLLYFTKCDGDGTKQGDEVVKVKSCRPASCWDNDALVNSVALNGELCAENNGRNKCEVDPGEPLMIRVGKKNSVHLAGIKSYKYSFCRNTHKKFPGVYTDISQFTEWINNTMNKYKEKHDGWIYENEVV